MKRHHTKAPRPTFTTDGATVGKYQVVLITSATPNTGDDELDVQYLQHAKNKRVMEFDTYEEAWLAQETAKLLHKLPFAIIRETPKTVQVWL